MMLRQVSRDVVAILLALTLSDASAQAQAQTQAQATGRETSAASVASYPLSAGMPVDP